MNVHAALAQWSAAWWPWFLNHLWQATAFAVVAIILVALLKRTSARTRYAVLLVALAKFAVPAAFLATIVDDAGLWPEPLQWQTQRISETQGIGGAAYVPLTTIARVASPIEIASASAPATVPSATHSETWCLLTIIWISGTLLILSRWARRHWRFVRSLGDTKPCRDTRAVEALDQVRGTIPLRRSVRLILSRKVEQPWVWGVWRPVVALPEAMLGKLSDPELEAVLAHELQHIKRWDNLAGYLQAMLCAALWFHPLVWWLDRRLLAEREEACDQAVVEAGRNRDAYAAGLLKVCRFSVEASPAGVSHAAASSLKHRMERIMSMTQVRDRRSVRWPLIAGLVLAALALSFVVGVAPVSNVRAETLDRFEIWLNEEVVYIINDKEKASFAALLTAPDREVFIEKFWRDRDPTPASPKNEFRDEHNRRLKYANARWNERGPGWKTDRGRIYTIYGPPDEIEVHPSDGVEKWRYKDGVFANVVLDFSKEWGNLHDAARRGDLNGVRDAMTQGADLNAIEKGVTPLALAANYGREDVAEFLIGKGADVNKAADYGQPPLLQISPSGSVSIVKLLLAAGAHINAIDTMGRSALIRAAGMGQREIVQLLLAFGADPNLRTTARGWTALETAEKRGRTEIVAILKAAGAR